MLDLLPEGRKCRLVVPPLRPFTVPAPTVRVALSVYSVAEGEAEAKARRTLRVVCSDWLSLRAFSVLFGEAFDWDRRLAVLSALVQSLTPDDVFSGEEDAEAAEWQTLIAQYRAAYRIPLEKVLSEKWHVFLQQSREIGTLQAREQVRFVRAYTAIRSTDGEDIMDDIIQSAQGRTADTGDELTDEEKEKRERLAKDLKAEAYQTRQHLLN